MVRPIIDRSADHILHEMFQASYGEHNLLICPYLSVLREIYSRYFNGQPGKNDNEVIVFLSTYQNIKSVRDTLRDVDVDVTKFEQNGSLVILDSVTSYFG